MHWCGIRSRVVKGAAVERRGRSLAHVSLGGLPKTWPASRSSHRSSVSTHQHGSVVVVVVVAVVAVIVVVVVPVVVVVVAVGVVVWVVVPGVVVLQSFGPEFEAGKSKCRQRHFFTKYWTVSSISSAAMNRFIERQSAMPPKNVALLAAPSPRATMLAPPSLTTPRAELSSWAVRSAVSLISTTTARRDSAPASAQIRPFTPVPTAMPLPPYWHVASVTQWLPAGATAR